MNSFNFCVAFFAACMLSTTCGNPMAPLAGAAIGYSSLAAGPAIASASGLIASAPIASAGFAGPAFASLGLAAPCPYETGRDVLVHEQNTPIIIDRPATNVVVDHSPVFVKPSPVVINRKQDVKVRPLLYYRQPKPIKLQPVYVKVIRPTEKVYIKKSVAAQSTGPIYSHTKVVPDCA